MTVRHAFWRISVWGTKKLWACRSLGKGTRCIEGYHAEGPMCNAFDQIGGVTCGWVMDRLSGILR